MKNGQEPAFPIVIDDVSKNQFVHTGLTKREYFAGLALQGMLAVYAGNDVNLPNIDAAAKQSIEYADALLAELAKEGNSND